MNYEERLRHTLKLAQMRFGPRVYNDTNLSITFHAGPAQVFFPSHSEVAVRLSRACEFDYLLGCYQLAHETIHLLSPVGGDRVTALEEGLATLFSHDYLRENIDIDWSPPTDRRYAEAMVLAQRFLGPRPDAILRLREQEPVISSITADLIHEAYPEVPMSLCLPLGSPFCMLQNA
jgi:hypothetical protein